MLTKKYSWFHGFFFLQIGFLSQKFVCTYQFTTECFLSLLGGTGGGLFKELTGEGLYKGFRTTGLFKVGSIQMFSYGTGIFVIGGGSDFGKGGGGLLGGLGGGLVGMGSGGVEDKDGTVT